MVLKTSEKTPLSALKFAELLVEAGLPAGVFNILSGFGPTLGDAIARNMDIRKLAFTGSAATGRKLLISSAESNMKKVTIEGKGLNYQSWREEPQHHFQGRRSRCCRLCCNDWSLPQQWPGLLRRCAFNNEGSRAFVQEEVYDAFVAKFTEAVKQRQVAPIVDDIQFDKVMKYIENGQKEGAKLLAGGKRCVRDGYYIESTVFGDVKDEMKIAKEEVSFKSKLQIFGPVLSLFKFKTIEEVIERANNTHYGLAAAVHTKDLKTALIMAKELQAGTVWVNCYNVLSHQIPFGGFKESGIGRDLGSYALDEYTIVKSVLINHA